MKRIQAASTETAKEYFGKALEIDCFVFGANPLLDAINNELIEWDKITNEVLNTIKHPLIALDIKHYGLYLLNIEDFKNAKVYFRKAKMILKNNYGSDSKHNDIVRLNKLLDKLK